MKTNGESQARKILREHIIQILSETKLGRKQSSEAIEEAADQMMVLLARHTRASKREKARIWKEGKIKVIKALRGRPPGRLQARQSSSGG